MNEHVILVAFEVEADTRAGAHEALMAALPQHPPTTDHPAVQAWWVAEDDRRDGSDLDSAVFVPSDLKQEQARDILRHHSSQWPSDHDWRITTTPGSITLEQGDYLVRVTDTGRAIGTRTSWYWRIEAQGDVYRSANDNDTIQAGMPHTPEDILRTLASFLEAYVEACNYETNHGIASENRDLFDMPVEVAEEIADLVRSTIGSDD